LVLARHPRSIRNREALASWLYGVAHRTAMKARRGAARRRTRETRAQGRTPRGAASPTWDEVQAVLDDEIRRLPPSYRAVFAPGVLEGRGGWKAAAELGVKEGTGGGRRARARQLLRRRLTRRGIELAAVLAVLSVADGAAQAAVPAALADVTLRFG